MGGDTASGNADERLAWNLRTLREQAGISQEAIAAAMRERDHPWHQSTVYRVESGKQTVRFGEAADLAEILGIGLNRLTWTSPEAVAADFIGEAGTRLRRSATAVADAVADLLATLAVAEHVLAVHADSPYPRVREAHKDMTDHMDLYDIAGAVAEGRQRYKERKAAAEEAEDKAKDPQGEPGADDQRAEGGDREQ